MMGEDLFVAPVLRKGMAARDVALPPGTWRADDGSVVSGPCKITVRTPLSRLPHFVRVK